MNSKSEIRSEAERLRGIFEARGAKIFEAEILQPAGALLNLYGEDIRARAFVTNDPLRGEMMLRPDFTVPLVQRHISEKIDAAKYTYAGEIFRRQEEDDTRPTEYLQVGYEVFGEPEPDADAEIFATISEALGSSRAKATIGSIDILTSAIEGLETPSRRKQALLRHLWRPSRFAALLERFSKPAPPPPPLPDPDVPIVGLRDRSEIEARIELLKQETETSPIDFTEVANIRALMAVSNSAEDALEELKPIAEQSAELSKAVTRFERLLKALSARGCDLAEIAFEASFGLTSLEYYSGFVFGFSAEQSPPVATGGRYDQLAASMNGGQPISAVGGVIRPELLLQYGRVGL